MAVDEDKLNAFLGRAVGDLGAAMSAILVLIGDELGLYAALARERLTSAALAERTGTDERYVREWLANQAAGGYVDYDAGTAPTTSTTSRRCAWPIPTVRWTCPAAIRWSRICST